MFKFITLDIDDSSWDQYISSCYFYDFHHTSCYHRIETKEFGIPKLLIAESENVHICMPLVIKIIPNTVYYDATSVYGYCGPVSTHPFEDLEKEFMDFFKNSLLNYCNQHNIISVFSRLHSIIPQKSLFNDFGEIIDLNKTVAIDLNLSLEDQRKGFRKSNKSEINQLKGKKGYEFQLISKSDDKSILEFVEIYLETMRKVGAKPYYFFDFHYFKQLLNNHCFECDLLVVLKDKEIAAGAIFTSTNSIMQYHLAGTKEKYMQDTPMKLILDEARKLGTEKGLKYLHLGGGVGGSDNDSLFHFKSGFSKSFFQFSVWNLIVNQKVYMNLVNEKEIVPSEYPSFFPLYRAF